MKESCKKVSPFLQKAANQPDFFLKDHVTLKTGVMADERSALPSQE